MYHNHEAKRNHDDEPGKENSRYQIMEHPFHYLILMQRSYSDMVSKTLLPYGISKYEWRILASLYESEMLTVTDLAYIAQIDKTRTSRHVELLTQRNLINRVQGKPDRRCAVVTLTQQGEAVYNEIYPLIIKLKDAFFKGIPVEEYHTFLSVLKQVKTNCHQITSEK